MMLFYWITVVQLSGTPTSVRSREGPSVPMSRQAGPAPASCENCRDAKPPDCTDSNGKSETGSLNWKQGGGMVSGLVYIINRAKGKGGGVEM